MLPPLRPAGYTLVELALALALLGIIAALAVPSLNRQVEVQRGRGSMNRLVGDLYLARMLAVREGRSMDLVLHRDAQGCLTGYTIFEPQHALVMRSTPIADDLGALCLRATGGADSVMRFNGRGMLNPPTRSFYLDHPRSRDTVLVSIAGRVRRTY